MERRNKQLRNPIFQEPEFVQSENTKNKASMLGQARGQIDQEDSSLLECFPVTSRAKKVCRSTAPAGDDLHSAPAPCYDKPVLAGGAYPAVDVRADMTDQASYIYRLHTTQAAQPGYRGMICWGYILILFIVSILFMEICVGVTYVFITA